MTFSPLLRDARERLGVTAGVLLVGAVVWLVYGIQLVHTNSYRGFVPIASTAANLGATVATLVAAGLAMPAGIRRPSDFFVLLYTMFVVLPYAVLFQIRAPISASQYALHLAVLLFPLAALHVGRQSSIGLQLPATLDARTVEYLVISASVIGIAAALLNRPATASFDITTVYDRRLEGREIFRTGSLLAYTATAVANGFVPYLAFIAGLRRGRGLLLLAIALSLALFYVLGLKAPVVFTLLCFALGTLLRNGHSRWIWRGLVIAIAVLFLFFLLERELWQVSFAGEYFFRRAFAVPADLMSAYLDLMFGRWSPWTLLHGIHTTDGITFYIGERYGQGETENANTNAFLYALGSWGLPGYFAIVLLVTAIFLACDMAFRANGNYAFFFLGFEYALLVSEQSATTALASSGIGILGLLIGLTGPAWTLGAPGTARIPAPHARPVAD